MVAVYESGNSVIVDVNRDVVQEDSNYQLGDASGNQPSSETQDVNPLELRTRKMLIQIFPYMAAVHESGNNVVVGVNPDVVQKNSDNQLGDAGNQTNSVTLEIEEDSNYQLGDASGNQPSSETQDVNPIVADKDAGNQLNSIDSTLYYKATKGDFHAFEQIDANSLKHLVTRVDENTILHICITAATPNNRKKTARTENNESVDFVNKALANCKELLWKPNKKGETILHIAARHGHHDIVRVLLTEDKEAPHNGQAVNRPQHLLEMKNEVGDTALHEAVRYNHLRVVNKLISEDRNYKYGQNNDGETPLYIAAEKGARNVVREILDACEPPAYEGPDKRTALHAAVLSEDDEMVDLLVEKSKEITRKADKLGWTPLHYAAHHGYLPIVKVLLEKDKDAAYIADKEEKTALHVAASKGRANVVKELMLVCPDCFEQVDKNGRNVLHFAVEAKKNSDKQKILCLVLQNECFSNLINAKDKYGNTPLHHAAATHSSARLLARHPKLNAQVFNKKNLSPLDILSAQSDLPLHLIWTSLELRFVDNRCNLRIPDKDNGKEREGIKDQDGINKDELDQEKSTDNSKKSWMGFNKFLREFNIVVATLIAAVTFAAGFTIPGGYISSDKTGPNQGSAVLIRNPALKAFVFSNTIALTLSSSVVLICSSRRLYLWTGEELKSEIYKLGSSVDTDISSLCTLFALIAMVIAFLSGTCAVLAPNPSLVTVLCILSTSLFFFLFYFRSLIVFVSLIWRWARSRANRLARQRLM